ncbi:hypothetical protein RKD27_009380 [Streptomyces sp. SAI-126]
MVRNQRKKSRDKARAVRTGASRPSAATGHVHRHDPVPDMSILQSLPHSAGNKLNLDFAGPRPAPGAVRARHRSWERSSSATGQPLRRSPEASTGWS